MSVAETQKQTAEAVVNGYNSHSVAVALAPRAADCIHSYFPASVGLPALNNEEAVPHLKLMFDVLKDLKLNIISLINDSETHRAVVRVSSTAETPVGPFGCDIVFFLTFTEDGKKVTRIEEMLDSAFSIDFYGKLQKYMMEKAAEGPQ